jgi:hypothetical protein
MVDGGIYIGQTGGNLINCYGEKCFVPHIPLCFERK